MLIGDANIILRIILNDNKDMTEKALDLIENNKVLIKNEVFAEVVYVALKVYKKEKYRICDVLIKFIKSEQIFTDSNEVIMLSLNTFKDSSFDFVDCILYAYKKVLGYEVATFDEKLKKFLMK